jgi:glycosyltransferase involved in cell wall biosynthesis
MLFSVLMAHYNNTAYLAQALDSVLQQTYSNWELILVDDASTENLDTALEPYHGDPRIKVFKNSFNRGCGYTKRQCAGLASGQLMGFLDPDDTLHPDALAIMVNAHMSKPQCSIIHSTHHICDEKLLAKRIADYPRALPPDIPYLLLNDGRVHAFATFKKSCYDRTEGISAGNLKAVDQDLYYKLEETGSIHFIDQPLYYYRIHRNSISNYGNEAKATLCHYEIIMEACRRRMKLKAEPQSVMKAYRVHLRKISIFYSFRKRKWLPFAWHLFLYPFNGGLKNLVSYFRKLPKQGMALVRRSFVDNYEIKA